MTGSRDLKNNSLVGWVNPFKHANMQITNTAEHRLAVVISLAALVSFQMLSLQAAEAAAGRRLHVGPGQTYLTPSLAAAAARDGDLVEIEAGEYPGDVAVWSASRLTLRGINGRAHLSAAGKSRLPGGGSQWGGHTSRRQGVGGAALQFS